MLTINLLSETGYMDSLTDCRVIMHVLYTMCKVDPWEKALNMTNAVPALVELRVNLKKTYINI